MSNFLTRLAARTLDPKPGLRPVTKPIFAPDDPAGTIAEMRTEREPEKSRAEAAPRENEPEEARRDPPERHTLIQETIRTVEKETPRAQPPELREAPRTQPPEARETPRALIPETMLPAPRQAEQRREQIAREETPPEREPSAAITETKSTPEYPTRFEPERRHLRPVTPTPESEPEPPRRPPLVEAPQAEPHERTRSILIPRLSEPPAAPVSPKTDHAPTPTPAPSIEVTIGRIEVRAASASPAPSPSRRDAPRSLRLDEYLRGKEGGKNEGKRR